MGVLAFVVVFQIVDIRPVLTLSSGIESTQVFISDSKQSGAMSWGPQQYVVDTNECIYLNDVNTVNPENLINRILKFDSSGAYLFTIAMNSVPLINKAWYGSMTVDPSTNDLVILGSDISRGLDRVSQQGPYVFRFSESGAFREAKKIPNTGASFLLYDYDGRFYTKHVDGATEFSENFTRVKDIPKRQVQGYSQWSEWVCEGDIFKEYTPSDSKAGKFLINLRNMKTNERLKFVFHNPPHHAFVGFVEGCDRHGNLIINAFKRIFLRVSPSTKHVAFVNLYGLSIPRGVGDVRHGTMVSPNGYMYDAILFRNSEEQLEYRIYRISPEMFSEILCDSVVDEKDGM